MPTNSRPDDFAVMIAPVPAAEGAALRRSEVYGRADARRCAGRHLGARGVHIVPSVAGEPLDPRFWWSVIFGANLGGNLTPIGSASTLVAVTIIHKHELSLSFARFVRTAFPYAVVQLLFATVYVLLFIG